MVSYDELKALIDAGKGYVLVDVREKHELSHGVIPSSHNISLSELPYALSLLPEEFKKQYGFSLTKNDRLILYCRTGGRSGRATIYARQQGFNAENYSGSIREWSEHDSNVHMYQN